MKNRIIMLLLSVAVIAGLVVAGCAPEAAPPAEEKPAPPEEEKPAPPVPPKAEVITWIGQAALPAGMPPAKGLDRLSARITEASGGRLVMKSYPAGAICPATEEWKAIDKGTLDFCAGGGSYMVAEVKFGSILSQRVGGIGPLAHLAWHFGVGGDLVSEWYDKLGLDLYEIPGGGFHGLPEGWIHCNKPIEKADDLKGLKMRASGDCGKVLDRMGVATVFMPLGEVFEAMTRGMIDAFECSNPAFDVDMGLHEAADYYYLSSTRAPTEVYSFLVARSKWEKLPDDLKVIVEDCARAEATYYYQEMAVRLPEAIQAHKDVGVTVLPLPASIDEVFVAEANKYLDEQAAADPAMAAVLKSMRDWEAMWKDLYGSAQY
jgi:TRAP-type mannitol/chloroaromatic compound transport system substrate-binding protein